MVAWLLVFGLIAVDRMHVTLMELDIAGRRFREQSRLLSFRQWRTERTVVPEEGCEVIDRVGGEPRIPGFQWMARRLIKALFHHRHRHLRKWYGVGVQGGTEWEFRAGLAG